MKKKKALFIISSFLIPLIVYTIVFLINGLLSKKTIASGDMFVQYYPLFNYLKGILNGTNSIFYSYTKGLGGTMFGTFFYYMSSPLNLLLIFIKQENIIYFIPYLIILKLSLCGLTMYIYMRKRFKKDSFGILVFSLCYSFMGYNLNYLNNIMWLDVVIMTPLVIMGLDKIIENKSPVQYIICLLISILSNYYISYMLCIFCVIYYAYNVILKKDKTTIKKFIISSLLAGLICSFFLIPCILETSNYMRVHGITDITLFDYNFLDIFSKTYIGSLDLNNILNYSSMNIYCGIVMLPLTYMYITNKRIDVRERKLTLLFIIIMIIPCFVGILNYIWHLFTIPSSYSFRYSFLLCFILIIVGYKSFEMLKITKEKIIKYLAFYSIISFFFVIITCFGNYYSFLNYKLIWLTIAILIIYLVLLLKAKKRIILAIILIEIVLNTSMIFTNAEFSKTSEYKNEEVIIKSLIDKYQDKNYRIETTNYVTYNDSLMMNYKGVSNFLSTTNKRTLDFIKNYETNYHKQTNLAMYLKQNYTLDSLLGIKYIITNDEFENYKLLEQIKKNDKTYNVYENPNSIGLGTIIKNKCNGTDNKFNCLFDVKDELYKEYKKKNNEYEIKKGYYYIYINDIENTNFEELNFQIGDELYKVSTDYFMYKSKTNKKIELNIDETIDKDKIKVMYFDYDKFKTIKHETFEILEQNKNELKGKINSKENGILMITIPYEKGFNIEVDSKKVEYFEVADTFIGINIEKGEHDIRITYKQPGLKTGILISLLSIISCIIYTLIYGKKDKYEKNIQ